MAGGRPESAKARKAREYCTEHQKMPSLTLAKLLYHDYPTLYKNLENARGLIRQIRGNKGEYTRKYRADKSLFRENGTTMPPKMPDSRAKAWEPFDMPGKCVLVLSDLHVPFHDSEAIHSAVNHAKEHHKISSVLLNGDIADMHSCSRWERAPDTNDLRGELNAVREFLVWLAHEFPRQPIVYKKGNHEEWLDKYYWTKAAELFGLPQTQLAGLLTINDDLEPIKEIKRVQFVGDQRPINVGKLTVFHGHELPKGLTNSVNPARGAFLRMVDTVLVGHHHRSSSHTEYTWYKQPIACWSTGALCDLTPEYARINKWNHGFAVVEVGKDSSFSVHNYKLMGKEVVTA